MKGQGKSSYIRGGTKEVKYYPKRDTGKPVTSMENKGSPVTSVENKGSPVTSGEGQGMPSHVPRRTRESTSGERLGRSNFIRGGNYDEKFFAFVGRFVWRSLSA